MHSGSSFWSGNPIEYKIETGWSSRLQLRLFEHATCMWLQKGRISTKVSRVWRGRQRIREFRGSSGSTLARTWLRCRADSQYARTVWLESRRQAVIRRVHRILRQNQRQVRLPLLFIAQSIKWHQDYSTTTEVHECACTCTTFYTVIVNTKPITGSVCCRNIFQERTNKTGVSKLWHRKQRLHNSSRRKAGVRKLRLQRQRDIVASADSRHQQWRSAAVRRVRALLEHLDPPTTVTRMIGRKQVPQLCNPRHSGLL